MSKGPSGAPAEALSLVVWLGAWLALAGGWAWGLWLLWHERWLAALYTTAKGTFVFALSLMIYDIFNRVVQAPADDAERPGFGVKTPSLPY